MEVQSNTNNNNNDGITEKCRFELNVEGMMCVKCTQKVEKALQELEAPIENLKIDFITNRILFTAADESVLTAAVAKLEATGFGVKDSKNISYTLSSDRRTVHLKVLKGDIGLIKRTLREQEINMLSEDPHVIRNKCTLVYNPILFRGSEIINKLNETPEVKDGTFEFKIEDFFEDDTSSISFSEFTITQMIFIIFFNILLVIASFFRSTEDQITPRGNGIYSYYFIAVMILTLLTIYTAGLKIYKTSFVQLFKSFNVNMMTLVSIGSGLGLIFGLVYTIWGTIEMIQTGNRMDPERIHSFVMNGTEMYFTASTILTAVVVGKYIEGRIKKRVFSRIDDIKKQLKVSVDSVTRIVPRNKNFAPLFKEELAPILIEKDDYIVIKAIGMIPFDGFIEKGTLKIVENIQYGWEKVETKTKGLPIMSGSQVIEVQEDTVIRVTEPLEKTLAGRLFFEIKEAASGSSSDNKKDDILAKVTKYFIGCVAVIGIFTLIGWFIVIATRGPAPHDASMSNDMPGMDMSHSANTPNDNGGMGSMSGFHNIYELTWSYPFERAIAVIVAACPCALGIAIPMLYTIALRKGFKSGVLIKETSSLDTLKTIDTIIFDKTGTITGTYNVKGVRNVTNKYDEASLWEMVSILEKEHLQHPVGLALFQESLQRISKLEKQKFQVVKMGEDKTLHEYFANEGIIDKSIKVNGESKTISLGNSKLLERLNIAKAKDAGEVAINMTAGSLEELDGKKEKEQLITLNLSVENEVQFIITLSLQENLKNNVIQLIHSLKKMNKTIMILSGDNKTNANQIGQVLGIPLSNIHAELAPEDKESRINELTKSGRKVMMVGDGINDIKAFKAATVSCSINFKSSQNLTFSDFIIIDNDVENISGIFKLSNSLHKFKIAILICALLYNVPAIIACTGALVTVAGIELPTFMAAWAMVAFSIFLTVVANFMEFVHVKKSTKAQRTSQDFIQPIPIQPEVIAAEPVAKKQPAKNMKKALMVQSRFSTAVSQGMPILGQSGPLVIQTKNVLPSYISAIANSTTHLKDEEEKNTNANTSPSIQYTEDSILDERQTVMEIPA